MEHDTRIVERVLQGDVEDFRILIERYQLRVMRLIRGLLEDPLEHEDMAQEAFLRAFTQLSSFQPQRGAFSTWLFTIARNVCLNARIRRRPIRMAQLPDNGAEQRPEANLVSQEMLRELDMAFSQLTAEQRSAWVLFQGAELSYAEISAIERIDIGTVKSRISRARSILQARLYSLREQAS